MIWRDLFPYVLPYVPGVPDATAVHHIRNAAIDFCRRTLAWQMEIDPIEGTRGGLEPILTTGGSPLLTESGEPLLTEGFEVPATDGVATEFTMSPPAESEIVKLLSVAVDDDPIEVVEASKGVAFRRRGTHADLAFTRDRKTLVVYPAPEAGTVIHVEAALRPSDDAAGLPDEFADLYRQDIAKGAVASLLLMPKQDWSDPGTGADLMRMFVDRIGTVGAQVARGFSRGPLRTKAYWF